jgi:hypothetical protein
MGAGFTQVGSIHAESAVGTFQALKMADPRCLKDLPEGSWLNVLKLRS